MSSLEGSMWERSWVEIWCNDTVREGKWQMGEGSKGSREQRSTETKDHVSKGSREQGITGARDHGVKDIKVRAGYLAGVSGFLKGYLVNTSYT